MRQVALPGAARREALAIRVRASLGAGVGFRVGGGQAVRGGRLGRRTATVMVAPERAVVDGRRHARRMPASVLGAVLRQVGDRRMVPVRTHAIGAEEGKGESRSGEVARP